MTNIMHRNVARAVVVLGIAALLGLAGCGSGGSASSAKALKDGTYEGKSAVHESHTDGDGYGTIQITVEGGNIASVDFKAFQVDGTPKDKNYGKDGAYYGVAQKAAATADEYAAALVEKGYVEDVDVISGATFMHDQFVEAAEDALSKAAE
ncbi:MAG TPA: hypothetical protein DCP91_10215 [Eggerthellaceae bacterium]|nr:hypothetical protein [Eggerthellaceae bacterium]